MVQAGLVQLRRRQRQSGVDPDRPGVVLLAAGQVDEPGLPGRPGPRQQLPDAWPPTWPARGAPPPRRRPAHCSAQSAALPSLRWPWGKHRAGLRSGQDPLGPGDGLLGQRGDRQPPLACPGPQPVSELVEPGAAAPQPGQVGLGRGLVDQDRPGRHRQESRRARVLHRGDRMLGARQVDAFPLLGGCGPGTVERDRLRGRQLPARDHVGFGQEPADLGAPGLLALLAVVREQIVIPGDAVHRGGERVFFQPAPVQPVGQVTC